MTLGPWTRRLRHDANEPRERLQVNPGLDVPGETMSIRGAIGSDFPRILELNEKSVAETSPLDVQALTALAAQSDYFKVHTQDDAVAGFAIGLRENAVYDNANFRWFNERFSRFLYVDRIVVDSDRRGMGIGSGLYLDLERHARETWVEMLAMNKCINKCHQTVAPVVRLHLTVAR